MNAPAQNTKPPLTLLLGPAGSGKTSACLKQYSAAPKGRALLLVPSKAYSDRLKKRLFALNPDADLEGLCTFGDLIGTLAGEGRKKTDTIRRTVQRLILADTFAKEIPADGYFGKMRDISGFSGDLAELIRELKLSGVTPDDLHFSQEQSEDPDFNRKLEEIARLYRSYEEFLQAHRLTDEEDQAGIATKAIGENPKLLQNTGTVFVDGFYRISAVWRDLLAAMAGKGAAVTVTLPYEAERPLLFAASERTRTALHNNFSVTERYLAPQTTGRPNVLVHLERGLFRGTAETPENGSLPSPSYTPLQLFDAPNPYTEVEMVVRALRKERKEHETPWSECAILLRSIGDYAPLIAGVCDRYDVPVTFHRPLGVLDNPLVKTLAGLLNVFTGGWQRDDVISLLKSGYLPLGGVWADSLRQMARRRGVREGRSGWERIAAQYEDEESPARVLLLKMLETDVTLYSQQRVVPEFTELIRNVAEQFGWRSRDKSEDAAALRASFEAMDNLADHALLSVRGPISFSEFAAELLSAWRGTSFSVPPVGESVSVIEPYDAGQLNCRFAAVMGLTERVFPRRVGEDPFLRDDERALLCESAGIELESRRERMDEERLLFYMAATAPSERLILSFPRSSDESDTLPSFYLDEVRSLFPHVPTVIRTLADIAPHPEETITERDRLLAACASLSPLDSGSEESPVGVREVIEFRNRPRLPRLEEKSLCEFAAPHLCCVTEIETYNRCPFQHLMRFGLGLRAESDGAGAMDKGTLFHSALRRGMRRQTGKEQKPSAAEMKEQFKEEFGECLDSSVIDARPHRRAMMKRALEDALSGFAEREERYREAFGLTAMHFELAFGMDDKEGEAPEDEEQQGSRDYDPASTIRPLIIERSEGAPISLCGAIDRVDVMDDGRLAMVMDYKLGNSVEWPNIKEGRSIQMPLYMLALEQLWGKAAVAGCYDSPRDDGRRRFIRRDQVDARRFQPIAGAEDGRLVKPVGPDEFSEALHNAQEAVRRAVEGIEAGEVLPTPGEHCRWCDYSDICRTGRDRSHDGEPMPPLPGPLE
jgi:ATP-dependent helicase/nuclease subunit B